MMAPALLSKNLRIRTHVNPWLIHVNVWKKPLQYCKVISLQLIKKKWGKKKLSKRYNFSFPHNAYSKALLGHTESKEISMTF